MNFDFDISDLSIENMGSWPWSVKIATCAILSILIFVVGYMFDTKTQFQELKIIEQQETNLRQEFERKQRQSASLEAYKLQLLEMQKTFGTLLRQLPSKTEVPGLLEDISQAGVASGLEFTLFDPLKEIHHDFYAELPIKINVVGNYHQFGLFISRIAALNRIVTLHDFNIIKNAKKSRAKNETKVDRKLREKPLTMQMTARTYRYIDSKGVQQ